MVFALRTAWEISWVFASVFFFFFFSLLPSSALPVLFVSLAYQRGGSLAVTLRAWLSPLYCIRQQWDWAVHFISANITASAHSKCLGELLSKELTEKVFSFLEGEWALLICPSEFERQSRLLPMLDEFCFSCHLLISGILPFGTSSINIQNPRTTASKEYER